MRRGTTPILRLKLKGVELTALNNIYVTMAQGSKKLTKSADSITIDGDYIKVKLTERETLAFSPAPAKVQLRATTTSGDVIASSEAVVNIGDVLYNEVIGDAN